jgi:hypothetical protein
MVFTAVLNIANIVAPIWTTIKGVKGIVLRKGWDKKITKGLNFFPLPIYNNYLL